MRPGAALPDPVPLAVLCMRHQHVFRLPLMCRGSPVCVYSNSDRTPSTCPWRSLLGFELTVRLSSHTKAHMGRGGPVVRLADRKTL